MKKTIFAMCIIAMIVSGAFVIGEQTPGGYFDEHFGAFVITKVVAILVFCGCIKIIKSIV